MHPMNLSVNKKTGLNLSPAKKKLAATYSRESYTIATIGNEAFDGRVRDGIGSGHFFIATKNCQWISSYHGEP